MTIVARRLGVLPAWAGSLLAALGLLMVIASFFLLPVDVVDCVDSCPQPKFYATAWEYSQTSLKDLPASLAFPNSLAFDVCFLVLAYLPLLAAVMVVVCSLGFLAWPQRAFARWGHRAWLVGCIALVLFLLVDLYLASFFGGGPELGFWGLLFGYGLLWAGNRVALNSA
ncbi:MAG TPA: hypothetical protein VFS83_11760 [Ktedonobacterales bacterium]|nr:hypothetical protein [Ktedonobacterales bacterium]